MNLGNHRPMRGSERDRFRLRIHRISAGVDQDQRAHALRMRARVLPGDRSSQRIAGESKAFETDAPDEVLEEARIGADAVVAGRIRSGEAEPGQVQAHHPKVLAQHAGPAVPGVQRGRGAVEQHYGRTRAFLPVVHLHAVDVDEPRGLVGPACLQRFERHVAAEIGEQVRRHQHDEDEHRVEKPANDSQQASHGPPSLADPTSNLSCSSVRNGMLGFSRLCAISAFVQSLVDDLDLVLAHQIFVTLSLGAGHGGERARDRFPRWGAAPRFAPAPELAVINRNRFDPRERTIAPLLRESGPGPAAQPVLRATTAEGVKPGLRPHKRCASAAYGTRKKGGNRSSSGTAGGGILRIAYSASPPIPSWTPSPLPFSPPSSSPSHTLPPPPPPPSVVVRCGVLFAGRRHPPPPPPPPPPVFAKTKSSARARWPTSRIPSPASIRRR